MRGIQTVPLFLGAVLRTVVVAPWIVLKFLYLSGRKLLLSARFWALLILLLIATLVAYYVLSDRYTPLTTDAYLQAYVIQIAPQVKGQVARVHVQENQTVKQGELLFEIDPRPFQHRVDLLTAKRAAAVQQVAQLDSDLAAAKAEDTRLVAEEAYARSVFEQEQAIYKQEATTDRKFLDATQKFKAAQAAVAHSQAQIRKAEQAIAARVGSEHALVAEVEAELASARLDLEWTRVYAPCDGLLTNLQLREGTYTHAGLAVLTLIDTSRWFVIANYRENALAGIREGQLAVIAFRGIPGQMFDARVQAIGWGVSQGQGLPSGQLPDVKVPANWVPPAQRFQVRLSMERPESLPLRVGMTGSVAVYTEPAATINPVTRAWHQLIAWLYYL